MTATSRDSETPTPGQQVITACAMIHHTFNGSIKVFLAKRDDSRRFLPGVYEMPGGHIDFGEDIVRGLKREIREELEVEVNIGDPFAIFDYTNTVKGSHSVEIIYFATLLGSPDDIKLHPENHSTAGWFARDELSRAHSSQKAANDPEFLALQKAFDLLEGQAPDFAD